MLDWVIRTGLLGSNDSLCCRSCHRQPKQRLSLLAYTDDVALLASSVEIAYRLNCLTDAVVKVRLSVYTGKTEILTVPSNFTVDITCKEVSGLTNPLLRCRSFNYLGGIVSSAQEDLRRRRGLAWAASRSIRVPLQAHTLPDSLKARLFKAVVESVLLYIAETLTLTESLRRQLDDLHSSLSRTSFRVHRLDRVSNSKLYGRLQLVSPSVIIH